MKYQLDQISNHVTNQGDIQLESELKGVEYEVVTRLNQVMTDIDNQLVKVQEIKQIKDKKELIKLEIEQNERDLKRKKD